MLALDFTDRGFDDGIDVTIHAEVSDQILFETIITDPKSQTLLTPGCPEARVIVESGV